MDGFKEGDVEDHVNLQGSGQLESAGVGIDAFQDLEFPNLLVVQLGRRVRGVDVHLKAPYMAYNLKAGLRKLVDIGVVGLSGLSVFKSLR